MWRFEVVADEDQRFGENATATDVLNQTRWTVLAESKAGFRFVYHLTFPSQVYASEYAYDCLEVCVDPPSHPDLWKQIDPRPYSEAECYEMHWRLNSFWCVVEGKQDE